MTRIETAGIARKHIQDADHDYLLGAVREWANCHDADVDDDSNIWIANPQTGHWLNDDHLIEFVNWQIAQET
jgi:hypothetical protein